MASRPSSRARPRTTSTSPSSARPGRPSIRSLLVTSRFPVLAHWEFTCSDESGDFAGYMNHLDVGLLGTAPIDDPGRRWCRSAATGHLAIEHTDRRGDAGQAWYRGPFTPTKITREPAGQPYHVADQARRIGTGRPRGPRVRGRLRGRPAAGDVGPAVPPLAAQWVRQEFVSRRHSRTSSARTWTSLAIALPFDALFGRELSTRRADRPAASAATRGPLGNPLPLHEADGAVPANDTQVLARGLGLEPASGRRRCSAAQLTNEIVDGDVLDRRRSTRFDEVARRGGHARRRCAASSTVCRRPRRADRPSIDRDRMRAAPAAVASTSSAREVGHEVRVQLRGGAGQLFDGGAERADRAIEDALRSRCWTGSGRLRMLIGVPFEYLVADDGLLRPETIRFFYVDRNWTDAAVDGAIAAGAYGTRDRVTLQQRHADVRDAVDDAERHQRVGGERGHAGTVGGQPGRLPAPLPRRVRLARPARPGLRAARDRW